MRRVHFVPALSFFLSCPATITTAAQLLRGSPKLISGVERAAAGVDSNSSPSDDRPENEILSRALHAYRTPYHNHRRQQHELPSDKEADRQLQSEYTDYYYQVPGTQSTQTAQVVETAPAPPPPVDIKCGTFALGMYWYFDAGFCYDLAGNWWDHKITFIRGESAGGACIEVRDDTSAETYCGNEWAELADPGMQVSTVCCLLQ